MDIDTEIVNSVAYKCGCGFTSDHLTHSVFHCTSVSPDLVQYQARLHETPQANVSHISEVIKEDFFREGEHIKVQLTNLFTEVFCVFIRSTAAKWSCDYLTSNTRYWENISVMLLTAAFIYMSISFVALGLLIYWTITDYDYSVCCLPT